MPYSHAKVDLALVPDCEFKETFIHFAERHNALVDGANEMKQDLDLISGQTTEEKEGLHKAMSYLRHIGHYIHGKRFSFNMTLIAFQAWLFLNILKQFGLTPEQFSRLMEAGIKILEKVN